MQVFNLVFQLVLFEFQFIEIHIIITNFNSFRISYFIKNVLYMKCNYCYSEKIVKKGKRGVKTSPAPLDLYRAAATKLILRLNAKINSQKKRNSKPYKTNFIIVNKKCFSSEKTDRKSIGF